MVYYCGIDIGGTFTDCVILDAEGAVTQSKVSTTPDDLTRGFMHAIEVGAARLGLSLESLLAQTRVLLHGTTVGTNLLVQMNGARAGLITTRGHRDALLIMRSAGRSMGLPIEQLLHVSRQRKPDPIIPPERIKEVTERTDWAGDIIAPLSESDLQTAVHELIAQRVDAIAISFLWGFVNPKHERRAREVVQALAPQLFVTCAHELVCKPGEYERTAAAAVNAYIGPRSSSYFRRLVDVTRAHGYGHPLLIMQASGGVVTAEEAAGAPLFTIGSGPVAGLAGCVSLARAAGHRNVIATDMGGTSFDVGLLEEGVPLTDKLTVVNQYSFYMPRLRVEPIGAGGGSILWIDATSETLRVGPHSAQAVPGPACYGRGGDKPTVSDANVVLGFFARDAKLSDGLALDHAAAERALATVAAPLGMKPVEAAAGAKRIIDHHMAGLMRQLTIERGLDPRDFIVYAFGGAAGLHASGYTRALGAATFVVPRGNLASGFSALGVVDSDLLHIHEHAELLRAPFDAAKVSAVYAALETKARTQLEAEGIAFADQQLERSADMKFALQIHEVEVPVPNGMIDPVTMAKQVPAFIARYEQIYGQGSAFPGAGTEIGVLRLRARGRSSIPGVTKVVTGDTPKPKDSRGIYWAELGRTQAAAVYDGSLLGAGAVIAGPAVVEYPATLVALHPSDSGRVDDYGNLIVTVGKESRV